MVDSMKFRRIIATKFRTALHEQFWQHPHRQLILPTKGVLINDQREFRLPLNPFEYSAWKVIT